MTSTPTGGVGSVGRWRLLDLFCGAGGAAVGYARAGFDVVGIDHTTQPRYPFTFHQVDALEVLTSTAWRDFLDRFDVIHASPPCQVHSSLAHLPTVAAAIDTGRHRDLINPVRHALRQWARRTGGLWVIENVPGAGLRDPLVLCGTEFALHALARDGRTRWLRRHRHFETNTWLMGAGGCSCAGRLIGGIYGDGGGGQQTRGWRYETATQQRHAMGAPWMTRRDLAQAIPPAYTHHIGDQLHTHLTHPQDAAA